MYGLDSESFIIKRSDKSFSNGKILPDGNKCLFLKNEQLWIVVEFNNNKKNSLKELNFNLY